MHIIVNARAWTAGVLLLMPGLLIAKDVKLIPCDNESALEIVAGQKPSVICEAEGEIHWRLNFTNHDSRMSSVHLASCSRKACSSPSFLSESFLASVRDDRNKMITINAENNTQIYKNVRFVNGNLECVSVAETYPVGSARCGLNYVCPPENVSCEGVYTSLAVSVSCVIGSVYSSRGIYKCELFSWKLMNDSLETVRMMTSPTSERITKSEVKVSGSCQFNTTLPSEEAYNTLFVFVSPGGRNYSVTFTNMKNGSLLTNRTSRKLLIEQTICIKDGPLQKYAAVTVEIIGAIVVIFTVLTLIAITRSKTCGKNDKLKKTSDVSL